MSWARLAIALAGLAASMLSATVGGHPALAQVLPEASPAGPGLNDLVSNPAAWLTAMLSSTLLSLGQKTTGDVVGFMDWLLGSGNIISQTPGALSYANQSVGNLWGSTRLVANAGLAVVSVMSGVNMMVHPHIRAPYHGALELVPRVLLSGIMINTSLDWGRFVVEMNNALSRTIGGGSMPGWATVQHQPPDATGVLLNLVAMAVYLVMGLLLLAQMLMRLALVDALLVVAPLALLCWVLPQTYGWARLWFSTFFGTVFVQSIQVLVLRLGSDLIQYLPTLLQSIGSDPLDAGRVWLMTLLLGVACLQLARKVPRLMPGVPSGIGSATSGLGSVRQIGAVFNAASAATGRRGGR
ncbi:MAG TPA: conjugal transfer protein TrbL family protein [Chloroflexota bacterium]